MKLLKTLSMCAAALSVASMANADVTFHITGSTAFRAAAITALQEAITGNSTNTACAQDNASVTSANNVMWTGSNATLGNFVIKASFNGSGAGTQLVSGNLTTAYIATSASGATPNVVATPTSNDGVSENVVPDVAMSDAFQTSTGFKGVVPTYLPLGTNQGASGTKQAHTYATLTDNKVAVVTFKPMASINFPQGTGAGLVDITGSFNVSSYSLTPENFNAIWSNGSASLSLFTGKATDQGTLVYATGRNQDSGTRITYLSETGYGVNNSVVQSFPGSIVSGSYTAITEYPIQTINGISTKFLGNSGESSGGAVRGYLTTPLSPALSESGTQGAYLITVLGTADSASVATQAVELPYCGVYYSDTNVEQGSYTMWGYEHMFFNPNLTGTGLTFANSVKSSFLSSPISNLANAGIPYSLVNANVSRQGDGQVITQQY